MRLGVLGGTFNPVHVGHLMLVEEAREGLQLDRVLLVPVHVPPHKHEPELIEGSHRLAMLRLAVDGHPQADVSGLELERGGRSYTVDTLEALKVQFGERVPLVFLAGADACQSLPSWRRFDRIVELCEFVVAHRPGYSLQHLPAGVRTLEIPGVDVSSTAIRQRVRAGRSIRYWVPDAVRQYIADHRLYAVRDGDGAEP